MQPKFQNKALPLLSLGVLHTFWRNERERRRTLVRLLDVEDKFTLFNDLPGLDLHSTHNIAVQPGIGAVGFLMVVPGGCGCI
jgi:hypothetical protein